MQHNTELQNLEEQYKNDDLTFEERIELKDKIIKIEFREGLRTKSSDGKISCIGCSG